MPRDPSEMLKNHWNSISEVGGVRTKWPQPGNRFVSFVRASGRAGDAREINCGYLEGFAG